MTGALLQECVCVCVCVSGDHGIRPGGLRGARMIKDAPSALIHVLF